MKKIIFSVWANITEEHSSVPDSKKQAFAEYKDRLIAAQKQYAHFCSAEYHIFEPNIFNYDDVQFYKLNKFESLAADYDEVVYFDLDIIPTTNLSIFDKHASNPGLGVHFIDVNPRWRYRNDPGSNKLTANPYHDDLGYYAEWWVTAHGGFDKMNMVVKSCIKNAMLDIVGFKKDNMIANTGVLIGNKNSIEHLKFQERFFEVDEIFKEAKEDNIYPEEISSCFDQNNEVYLSFMKDYYNIPINKISLAWNWIIDETFTTKTNGAYLHHIVNKNFKMFEEYLPKN